MSSTQDSTTTLSATSDASSATLGTNPNVEKALVSLEDDDEFEDFPVEDWNDRELDPDLKEEHLWEEKWDDDDAEDDFSKQLKAELEKRSS